MNLNKWFKFGFAALLIASLNLPLSSCSRKQQKKPNDKKTDEPASSDDGIFQPDNTQDDRDPFSREEDPETSDVQPTPGVDPNNATVTPTPGGPTIGPTPTAGPVTTDAPKAAISLTSAGGASKTRLKINWLNHTQIAPDNQTNVEIIYKQTASSNGEFTYEPNVKIKLNNTALKPCVINADKIGVTEKTFSAICEK